MNSTQVFMVALLGGMVPTTIQFLLARWSLQSSMRRMEAESKFRCPVCKRSGAIVTAQEAREAKEATR